MKTLKLIGLGNDQQNNRSYFFLEKSNLFLKYFNEILEKIGISRLIYDELGQIEEKENELEHFKNDNFDIDVIYTSNRIIILVRASQEDLERFKSLILAYSTMDE